MVCLARIYFWKKGGQCVILVYVKFHVRLHIGIGHKAKMLKWTKLFFLKIQHSSSQKRCYYCITQPCYIDLIGKSNWIPVIRRLASKTLIPKEAQVLLVTTLFRCMPREFTRSTSYSFVYGCLMPLLISDTEPNLCKSTSKSSISSRTAVFTMPLPGQCAAFQ